MDEPLDMDELELLAHWLTHYPKACRDLDAAGGLLVTVRRARIAADDVAARTLEQHPDADVDYACRFCLRQVYSLLASDRRA